MTKAEINKRIFELPEDTEVVDCRSNSAPHSVFRSDKIIISNPRTVTDDIAMELYLNLIYQKNPIIKLWLGV